MKNSLDNTIKKLHPLEIQVLTCFKETTKFEEVVEKTKLKNVEVMRALQWMENKNILKIKTTTEEEIVLLSNAKACKKQGFPEIRFLEKISEKELSLTEIKKETKLDKDELNVSIGFLKKKKAISIRKEGEMFFKISKEGKKLLKTKSPEQTFLEKKFPVKKNALTKKEKEIVKELSQRKNFVKIVEQVTKNITLTTLGNKLVKLNLSEIKVVDKLTLQMLKEGSWKKETFRSYDVESKVPRIHGGRRHFTNEVVDYIKRIWLDIGFKEMEGRMIHSAFMDLDALFVPQDHPAREEQDTFYLKNPKKAKIENLELMERVKKTHQNGWITGSIGWGGNWSEKEASQNLLRTHTTVLSAETLSKLKKEDLPAKYFAVGKVFRNEALDWKHLFEFYQVEGIVVDEDANFRNLLGYLKNFFYKLGFPDVRIRPGHFPYTEPSAEVDVWHTGKKQWIELGGSGIFRPEVTKPLMNFEVPVLAWGIGLGRMMKEYWNIEDLRDLYKNNIRDLRNMKMWLK